MQVFISSDMEGATGVVHADDIIQGKPGYESALRTWRRRCGVPGRPSTCS
jgi:D-aminopeptidase